MLLESFYILQMSWNVYAWTHPLVSTVHSPHPGGHMVSAVYSVLVTHKPVPGRCREHSTPQRPVLSALVLQWQHGGCGMFTIQCS